MKRDRVAVVGTGMTDFREHWGKSWIELIEEAGLEALKDAGLEKKHIDEYHIGVMSSGMFQGQEHITAKIKGDIFDGYKKLNIYGSRTEGACASGGLALNAAHKFILSGLYQEEKKIIMAGGFEKMKDEKIGSTTRILGGAADMEKEILQGGTFPGLYALMADKYMTETGATEDDLHLVAVKNHKNATKNPKAQYRREITLEDVKKSSPVADPFRLLDCSPVTDGAAGVVLMPESEAEELGLDYVILSSIEGNTDSASLQEREDIMTLGATVNAAKKAYKESGITPDDVDIVEAHDCFTISEILAMEDLGFCEKGEGYKIVRESMKNYQKKDIPIPYEINGREVYFNPSGGLKAKGHPVGATGIAQIVEVVNQLRGRCKDRQIKDPKVGLIQNVGGTGGTVVVGVLRRNI